MIDSWELSLWRNAKEAERNKWFTVLENHPVELEVERKGEGCCGVVVVVIFGGMGVLNAL